MANAIDYTYGELLEQWFGDSNYEVGVKDLPFLWEKALIEWSYMHEITLNRFRDKKLRLVGNLSLYEGQAKRVASSYNKVYKLVMLVRGRYRKLALSSPEMIELEKKKCTENFFHWANVWCELLEPRYASVETVEGDTLNPKIPFIPFKDQARMISNFRAAIIGGYDTVTAKSREMGQSQAAALMMVHFWLFKPDSLMGMSSEKEAMIDFGKSKTTLFGKVRTLLYSQPDEFLPESFRPVERNGDMVRPPGNSDDAFMRIVNPDNGSEIIGYLSGGSSVAEGSRLLWLFFDEIQNVSRGDDLLRSLATVARSISFLGTPRGYGNILHRLFTSGNVVALYTSWCADPRKVGERFLKFNESEGEYDGEYAYDSPWRQFIEATTDKKTIASAYDIKFSDSVDDLLLQPRWVEAARAIEFLDEDYANLPKVSGFDIAGSSLDSDEAVLVNTHGPIVAEIEAIKGEDVVDNLLKAADLIEEFGSSLLNFDKSTIGNFIGPGLIAMRGQPPYALRGIFGNSAVPDVVLHNGENALDTIFNMRAYNYWNLRRLFQNTFEHAEGMAVHDPVDMIQIPRDNVQLRDQLLSIRIHNRGASGKWQVMGKREMKLLGLPSPDLADALCYAKAPKVTGIVYNSDDVISSKVISMFDKVGNVEYFMGHYINKGSTNSVLVRFNGDTRKIEILSDVQTTGISPIEHLKSYKGWVGNERVKVIVSEQIFEDMYKGNPHQYQSYKVDGIKPLYNDNENLVDTLTDLNKLFGDGKLVVNAKASRVLGAIRNAGLTTGGRKLDGKNGLLTALLLAMQFVKIKKRKVMKTVRKNSYGI